MLHSVMQQSRQLTLPNGDRMFMEGNLQLVFETDSLAGVSPAIILPSGKHSCKLYSNNSNTTNCSCSLPDRASAGSQPTSYYYYY